MTPATTSRPRPRTARLLIGIAGAIAATAALAPPALGQTAPPGRAYEQVSPVEKNGNDVASSANGAVPTIQASPDGSRIAYGSTGGFADTPSVLVRTYYMAQRGADWTTSSLMPVWDTAQANGWFTSVMGVSPDGTRSVIGSQAVLAPGAVQSNGNFYMRDNTTGALTLIVSAPPGTDFSNLGWYGNADFSRVAFNSRLQLLPDATPGQSNGYTWSATTGLELVTRLPDGTPIDGLVGNGQDSGGDVRRPHYVSADGSRVFF